MDLSGRFRDQYSWTCYKFDDILARSGAWSTPLKAVYMEVAGSRGPAPCLNVVMRVLVSVVDRTRRAGRK